ncbi:MAG: FAD-dependent oxidoreductase [Rhodothermales bacterium]|nr:FAD-dependent oxidoreductase [Rhodothermales bacterium]
MAYDYDLIVIGGGAAGLTGSGLGVSLGAKTLMVESERLGGDCTWYGCVPSKVLLKAAKAAQTIRDAGKYGLIDSEPQIDFAKVIRHVHDLRNEIYEDADRPEIYEKMGVEVAFGTASFIDPHTIEIESEGSRRSITSRYFLIATGAKAFVPPIEGIESINYLTNESLFEVDSLPPRLVIVGGGPIGCEMAQSFARLGSDVTIVDMADRVLPRDDAETAGYLQQQLVKDGVTLILKAGVKKFEQRGDTVFVTVEDDGGMRELETDSVLMATGRRANVRALNLESAGVEFDKGVVVNEKCRTNVRHIYASGDVTGRYQFTHMSEHMSKVAVTNALSKFPLKIDSKHVPWVTYTEPEVGHLGATREELEKAGESFLEYRFPYSRIDRAITDSEANGLIKVYGRRRSGKILGADIAGVAAGELISELAVAMRNGVSLRNISDTIHPYPSYGLGVRRVADQWYVKNHSTIVARLLKFVFRYRGPLLEFEPGQIV